MQNMPFAHLHLKPDSRNMLSGYFHRREGDFIMQEKTIVYNTSLGAVRGIETEHCVQFLGVPYARASRFDYAAPVEHWDGELDATAFGPACPQNRAVHEHLENPTRRFYKKEFREGQSFRYDEDCLNLNIYAPKGARGCPVVLFFHGGGFDSGMNSEGPFDGSRLAGRGIVTVFANYRLGVLGYLTHEEIRRRTGRDGNFGLDDQLTAVRWVKAHIADFGGDGENITLLGQSAGAISIQDLCLNPDHKGLFQRAAMMSGGGLFPRFAQPKRAEDTHAYWQQFQSLAGCKSFDELCSAPLERLFDAVEEIKKARKDNLYNTMPVVDGLLIPDTLDRLMKNPLPIDYMLGFTNADMYAPFLAYIGRRFGKQNRAYLYYFDLDAPGDDNRAFHSCDLRYAFETLDGSWRPYGTRDHEAAVELASYLANFARSGDPNGPGLPRWNKAEKGVLRIAPGGTKMGHVNYWKLTRNFIRRPDPKA